MPTALDLPRGGRVRGDALRRGGPDPDGYDLLVALSATPPARRGPAVAWVCWPDLALPASTRRALAVLSRARERAVGERVTIACGHGVGRTGTALALLVALDGVGVEEAVERVRRDYHRRAVETPWQHGWLRRVVARLAE